jgi:hypothetical protein
MDPFTIMAIAGVAQMGLGIAGGKSQRTAQRRATRAQVRANNLQIYRGISELGGREGAGRQDAGRQLAIAASGQRGGSASGATAQLDAARQRLIMQERMARGLGTDTLKRVGRRQANKNRAAFGADEEIVRASETEGWRQGESAGEKIGFRGRNAGKFNF